MSAKQIKEWKTYSDIPYFIVQASRKKKNCSHTARADIEALAKPRLHTLYVNFQAYPQTALTKMYTPTSNPSDRRDEYTMSSIS